MSESKHTGFTDQEKAAFDAGAQFGMNMLRLVPTDDKHAPAAAIDGATALGSVL